MTIVKVVGPHSLNYNTYSAAVVCGTSIALRGGFISKEEADEWVKIMIPKVEKPVTIEMKAEY